MAAIRRYAVVNPSGVVENVVLWDGETPWSPPIGRTAVPDSGGAEIKGTWTGTKFDPPPVPEPTPVSEDERVRQAYLAASDLTKLDIRTRLGIA